MKPQSQSNKESQNLRSGSNCLNTHSNLFITLAGVIVFTAFASFFIAYVSSFILSSFENAHAMAMLITNDGIKSDDKQLEHNLNSATQALIFCRDLGWALGIGCVGMAISLIAKWRKT